MAPDIAGTTATGKGFARDGSRAPPRLDEGIKPRKLSLAGCTNLGSGSAGRRARDAAPARACLMARPAVRGRVDASDADDRLTAILKALSSPVRLRILEALREPTRAVDVRLRAGEERQGFSADRILSRPAIVQHLQVLEEVGLVKRVGEGYVVDQATMFDVVQELGGLARIRAVRGIDVDTTREARPAPPATLPPPPRLVVVGGPDEGHAFRLDGRGPWTLGRGDACDVRLVLDPGVSRLQATLHKLPTSVQIEAAATKNPVTVDYAPLQPGFRRTLAPGSVVGVGGTRVVYQA